MTACSGGIPLPDGTGAGGTTAAGAPGTASNAVAESIVSLTNQERMNAGRPTLERNAQLMRAAQIHAEQMASAQRLSHDLPGAPYPTLTSRLAAVGYLFRTTGENISWNQPGARAAVTSWMQSQGHRDNMLSAGFTEMGAGYATNAGQTYYVQVFGSPR